MTIVVSLPIEDRSRAHRFYQEAFGLEAVGGLADDGIPEPLQFVLDRETTLMLIPRDGFGWVIGDNSVAERGISESLLTIVVDADAEVVAGTERAMAAGASVVAEPSHQTWGHSATIADPDGHLWMIMTVPD
jgi:predicted lactoylglutathione lyase